MTQRRQRQRRIDHETKSYSSPVPQKGPWAVLVSNNALSDYEDGSRRRSIRGCRRAKHVAVGMTDDEMTTFHFVNTDEMERRRRRLLSSFPDGMERMNERDTSPAYSTSSTRCIRRDENREGSQRKNLEGSSRAELCDDVVDVTSLSALDVVEIKKSLEGIITGFLPWRCV